MTESTPRVRVFDSAVESSASLWLGEGRIVITPAVEAAEGESLSAYSARFARGTRAELPAPYQEEIGRASCRGRVWNAAAGRSRRQRGARGRERRLAPR